MARLYAGTSGFAYSTWKPDFYPSDVPQKNFLEYYSRRLNSVEINYTFRHLPAAGTLESWVAATAPDFLFSLKAHMRITHILRLKDTSSFTEVFLRAIDPLRSARRLGPILFQLPPQMRCDAALLSGFLEILPEDLRYTFEFRHASWMNDEVYRVLEKRNVCLCLAESEKFETPEVITAGFVYSRLRKPNYPPAERAAIREKVDQLLADGRDVFVYFKHEDTPEGAFCAEELLKKSQKR
jgi:uncharacterized protein YecE (DUF72 family)